MSFTDDYLKAMGYKKPGSQKEAAPPEGTSFTEQYFGAVQKQREEMAMPAPEAPKAPAPVLPPVFEHQDAFDRYMNAPLERDFRDLQKQRAEEEKKWAKDKKVFEDSMREINALSKEEQELLKQIVIHNSGKGSGQLSLINTLGMGPGVHIDALLKKGHTREEIDKWSETLARKNNADFQEKVKKFAKDETGSGFLGGLASNLLRVPAALVGGATQAVGAAEKNIGFGLGGWKTYYDHPDDANPAYALSDYASTVSQVTSDAIRGSRKNPVRKFAGDIYRGVSSAADNLARIFSLGGAGSLAMAGLSSFGSTYRDAENRGASQEQATALALASGGLEILTEKVSVDRLINTPNPTNLSNLFKNAAIQGGIEVTEEEASFVGNTVADALIMGKDGKYQTLVKQFKDAGYSDKEAKFRALDALCMEAADTAYQSFLSGSIMSGATGGVQLYRDTQAQKYANNQNEQSNTQEMAPEAQEAPLPEVNIPENNLPTPDNIHSQAVQEPIVQQNAADNNVPTKAPPSRKGSVIGSQGVTYADPTKPIQFHYAVFPADSLVVSHDQYGNTNKNYPEELQPRDRTRTASVMQISSIANNLNPDLLADSPTAQNGAPIVTADGVVVSGNGRSLGIKVAYEKGKSQQYQEYLAQNAERFGIDPNAIPENPVLVRVVDDENGLKSLASGLNASTVSGYSATEQAIEDAGKMEDVIGLLTADEDGNLNTTDNKAFIGAFVNKVVPESQRGSVAQADGSLSKSGLERVTNAVLYYAYGRQDLVTALSEDTDPDSKNLLSALVATAPAAVSVRNGVDAGELHDVGVIDTVINAVDLYTKARQDGVSVKDYASQETMFDGFDYYETRIAEFMEANKRSAKQMRLFLNAIYSQVKAAGDPNQVGMFGDSDVSLGSIMEGAVNEYEAESGRVFPREASGDVLSRYAEEAKRKSDSSRRSDAESGTAVSGGNETAESGEVTEESTQAAGRWKNYLSIAEKTLEGEKEAWVPASAEMRTQQKQAEANAAKAAVAEFYEDVENEISMEEARQKKAEWEAVREDAMNGKDSYVKFQTRQIADSMAGFYEDYLKGKGKETVAMLKESLDATPTVGAEISEATEDFSRGADGLQKADLPEGQKESMGAADNPFKTEVKQSKLVTNTYKNAVDEEVKAVGEEAVTQNPRIADYDVVTEKESLHNAEVRTATPEDIQFEYDDLLSKDGWTGEDNDTAFIVLEHLRDAGDVDSFMALAKKQREQNTQGGQLIQSNAKYTRTPTGAAVKAVQTVGGFQKQDVAKRFHGKDFSAWQKATSKKIMDFSKRADAAIDSNDVEALRDLIREMAAYRRTTAWFGSKSRLTNVAEKIVSGLDLETAKEVAAAQISRIPNDFMKRSPGSVIKEIRIMNMLHSVPTIIRNLGGNSGLGLADSVADSSVGVALDSLMSKFTGKRVVKSDIANAKDYYSGAKDAVRMASLAAELDIALDQDSKFNAGRGRTFSPKSGVLGRYFSALEKYLNYTLEVTDAAYEGGTEAAVAKSLEKTNLSDKEKAEVAEEVGKRRTFKEDRKIAEVAKGVKSAANKVGIKDLGAGDLLMTFERVPSNMASTAADYLSGGINGIADCLRIIQRAKKGEKVTAVEQSKAVRNAARGISGLGLIATSVALALRGIIVADGEKDKDKRSMDFERGLGGVKLNVSAALRFLSGKGDKIEPDDVLVDISYIEPASALMLIGTILSKEDSAWDAVKKYPGTAVNATISSIMEAPMMEMVREADQLFRSFGSAAETGDPTKIANAAGKMAGTLLSGIIPAPARQIAQTIDPYFRDTTGQNAADAAVRRIMSQIPGVSKYLPKKYDSQGNESRRYAEGEGFLGFLNNAILPGKITKYSPNEIASYLDELSDETGSKTIYPESYTPKSFKVGGEDFVLDKKADIEKYDKTYGENAAMLYDSLISSKGFSDLPLDVQVSAFESAKEYAANFAKAAVSDFTNPFASQEEAATKLILNTKVKASGLSEARYGRATERGLAISEMAEVSKAVTEATKGIRGKTDNDTYRAVIGAVPKSERSKWLSVYGMSDARIQEMDEAEKAGIPTGSYLDYLDAKNAVDKALTDITKAWKEGETPTLDGLADAYEVYEVLPDNVKGRFQDSLGGKLEAFADAMDAGIDERTFVDLWHEYYNMQDNGEKNTANATEWARILDNAASSGKLTDTQADVMRDGFGFYSIVRAEAKTYDSFRKEGLKPDAASYVVSLMDGLTKDAERLKAISGANLSDTEKKNAMYAVLDDKADAKLKKITDAGFSPDWYSLLYEAYQEQGRRKKDTIAVYQQKYGLNYNTALWVYQVYNPPKK